MVSIDANGEEGSCVGQSYMECGESIRIYSVLNVNGVCLSIWERDHTRVKGGERSSHSVVIYIQ